MSDWIAIAQFEELPRLGARVVQFDTVRVAVFRTSTDAVFAVKDACPHRGGPLSQGIVHGNLVTCPMHNWRIDLATGEAVQPDVGCVHTYETKIEAGRVYLRLSDAPGAGQAKPCAEHA